MLFVVCSLWPETVFCVSASTNGYVWMDGYVFMA